MYLCFFYGFGMCGEKKIPDNICKCSRVSSVEVLAIKTSTSVAIIG